MGQATPPKIRKKWQKLLLAPIHLPQTVVIVAAFQPFAAVNCAASRGCYHCFEV